MFISNEQRRTILAERHRLTRASKTDTISDIADSLVGLHSSDPSSVFLSAIVRMDNPSTQAVHDQLYKSRSIVRHHAMRRTLWVFSRETATICHAAATLEVAARERRRTIKLLEEKAGLANGDAWLTSASAQVIEVLHERGHASTRELGVLLPELKVPIPMSADKPYSAVTPALGRLLLQLGFEGSILRGRPRGGWNNSEYSWSLASSWIPGGLGQLEVDDARCQLAQLWLKAYGPAPASDLQWWSGWTKGATTKALKAVGREVQLESDLDGTVTGWIHPDDIDSLATHATPWVAFLPALDPTTMGWKKRNWYIDDAYVSRLFDRNGNGGPTVWVNGRVVGGWTQLADGQIAYRLLEAVSGEQAREIDQAAELIREVVGDTRFKTRFPVPLQTELAG